MINLAAFGPLAVMKRKFAKIREDLSLAKEAANNIGGNKLNNIQEELEKPKLLPKVVPNKRPTQAKDLNMRR